MDNKYQESIEYQLAHEIEKRVNAEQQLEEKEREAAKMREAVLVGLGAAKFSNMSQEIIDKMTAALNSSDMGKDRDRLASDLRAYANDIERALAQPSDSPAVPDGYVLVPREPTEGMLAQLITSILMVEGASDAIRLMRRNYYRAIAAAPDPTGGDKR